MGAYDYTLPFIEISQRGTILTVVFSTIGIEALIGLGVGTILVFALFAIDQCPSKNEQTSSTRKREKIPPSASTNVVQTTYRER